MRVLFICLILNLFLAQSLGAAENSAQNSAENSAQNSAQSLIENNLINPDTCKSCHREQMRLWQNSWHSKNNAELYNAVVEIVAKEQNELKAQTLISCSNCHNPHLNLLKINNDYLYSKLFNLKNSKTEAIDDIIDNLKKLSGVNCFVCHRIDSIDNNESKTGAELITWLKEKNVFVGPNENIKSVAHKNEYREHFNQNNGICQVCHTGVPAKDMHGNLNLASAYNTSAEMIETDKKCIDCHMGEPYEITILDKDGKDRKLKARPHFFNGPHDITKLREGFHFAYKDGVLKVKNTTPHMAPTGFGSRLLDINMTYFDQNGKIIESKTEEITSRYEKNGSPTFQYLADLISFDNRLSPNEERPYKLEIPQNATNVSIVAKYYYVDPKLVKQFKMQLSEKALKPVELFNSFFKIK